MAEERIALYLRISRDDERAGESSSIENQRSYLLQYLQSRDWVAEEIYIDDGYTGTNFERPGFQQMLEDIDKGRINTVITKDLSRLGRDQIGTAYYYQICFPKKKVRYIAVAEGLDTAEGGGSTNALLPFLTAANDFYVADISRKVRSALTARRKEGKFIGSRPPLGYEKDPNEPGHLIVEPEGAEIVRQIFVRYLRGGSVIGVAKELTEENIPTPSQHRQGGLTQERFKGAWNDTMVRRILANPSYAGHITQNRTSTVNHKVKQRNYFSEDQWLVVKNTHEPLVSQADFDRVQEMLRVRSYGKNSGKHPPHLLTGLAFCADCGSTMTYVRESPTRTYMVCQGARRGGRLNLCTSHSIREDRVKEAIQTALRDLAKSLDEEALRDGIQGQAVDSTLERQCATAQNKLNQLGAVLEKLYQDRTSGLLLEGEFQSLLQSNRSGRARWQEILEQSQRMITERETQQDATAQVRQFLQFEHLDRPTVVSLLERVLIHQDKTIELIFKFQNPG